MEQEVLTIKQKVNEYVLQHTFAEKHKIQDDSLIFKEGYFDSMGFILLITFIEEEFAISVGDADLIEENFESINAIASYVSPSTGLPISLTLTSLGTFTGAICFFLGAVFLLPERMMKNIN